jgi:hypothetical protein
MSERVYRHLLSQLLCMGRHTVTGILGTCGQLFDDWSADYRMYSRQRVDLEKLFTPVRQTLTTRLVAEAPLITALDDTNLRKWGSKTDGVKYFRDPLGPPFWINLIKAQRFLQLSMATIAETGMVRMVPIDFTHAPAAKKPGANSNQEDWRRFRWAQRQMALPQVGADRLRALRKALDQEGQEDRPLWVTVDGSYTNGTFFKQLPARTHAIGRIRADAKLYYLPEPSAGKPGRNRVYGPAAATPQELRQDPSIPWQKVEAFATGRMHQFKIKTLAPLRWRPAGKEHDLRLIVIAPLGYRLTKNSRILYRKPAYLICTNPQDSLQQLLQAYLWRWDIEVNFRDEKTLLGVGQAQVRNPQSVASVPTLAVAAYAMLLTAAIRLYGDLGKPDSLPPPKWRPNDNPRASTQLLIQELRHQVWGQVIRFSSFVPPPAPGAKPQEWLPSLEGTLIYATG